MEDSVFWFVFEGTNNKLFLFFSVVTGTIVLQEFEFFLLSETCSRKSNV
jgi:hypothetical protein